MNTKYKNQQEIEKQNEVLLKELEDLKQKFVESEKLAFIGKLSAGILHEIKNPLNFINNFARLSQDLMAESKEIIENTELKLDEETLADYLDVVSMLEANLTKILENGERAQRIVFSMLAQSHSNKETIFESADVNQLVDEFAKLAYQGVRGNDNEFNVTIKTDFDPAVGSINLGYQEISRVIINIVNNACYALNEKKKELKDAYSPEIRLTTLKVENTVEIYIRDNGPGIPQVTIDKLFTPFFTTKPKGQGTGLGLSLSHDIITLTHKGDIVISSKENEFTEFKITIPTNLS